MVALPQVKKVADCDTGGGGGAPLIPAGQYKAIIVNSEMKENSKKTGSFLALNVVITDGEYKDVEFIERLNLVNQNPQAVDIAFGTLAKISKAFGMTSTPADSTELHNKPLMIEIKNKKANDWVNNDGVTVEGKDQSEIKGYLPLPASGVAPVAAAAPAPTEEVKVATNDAPANNPFAKKG